jgi:hypothetical protein
MKLDKKAVQRLLALNDEQLRQVLLRLAGENGIDLSGVNVGASDMAGVRQALRMATQEDILKAAAALGLIPPGDPS